MKTLNITCKNVKHTLNAIQNYPILSQQWLILPPDFIFSPSHRNYSIYICFEHNVNGEKMTVNLAIPLFKTTVKTLLQNGAHEQLMRIALTTKHNKLIKYMWRYIDKESQKIIMTEVLGGK